MTATELTMDDVRRDKEALHAWLRAHDLDPDVTAPGVVVRDGQVHATVYIVDEHGMKQLLRDTYDDRITGVRTREVAVPLRAPVPAGLGTVTA